jgi:alkanesulfonate monooxygenase SsuD/methylene tetrahydromethanopterin reductase-like flavin-dependent oxidoreductase (luciferase family)
MTAMTPIIGRTRADAEALQKELDNSIPAAVAIGKLESLLLNFDLSPYSADGPLPLIPVDTPSSIRDRVVDLARRENLPISELAKRVSAGRTSRTIVGTAQDVADELEAWYRAGAADGFVISPPFLPASLEDFVDGVIPILQEKGLFRRAYEGQTLRENLGLARPENLFAANPALGGTPEIW